MDSARDLATGAQTTSENLKITRVRAFQTAPDGIRLIIVRIETNVPGLYGLGCATFAQRPSVVVDAVENFLEPLLIGRDPSDIEDIWHAAYYSSYWRGGPALNNALSGIDEALWDILGKRLGVPVYQLFGGRVRESAEVYVHVNGRDQSHLNEGISRALEHGYRVLRCQVGFASSQSFESSQDHAWHNPQPAHRLAMTQNRWDPRQYARDVPTMFAAIRSEFGNDLEIIHDVHEKVPPAEAIRMARAVEEYRPYFLEDPVAPEDVAHLERLRSVSAVPIGMGELFTTIEQAAPLISKGLIDFLRVHVSALGGVTPTLKLVRLCEVFGVRTAWHGPTDLSPVGQAANIHLNLATTAFGIQEFSPWSERMQAVFPGSPTVSKGAFHANSHPGWGVDFDEKEAAKYPHPEHKLNGGWLEKRQLDGCITRP